jgi:integration host factor subunit beta
MTKAELVDLITGNTGLNRRDTVTVVNLIMENIGNALAAGDKVELRGFGSFKVKSRRSRLARNPRTGDSVDVPAKRVPYFKASNELKDRLNGTEGSSDAE